DKYYGQRNSENYLINDEKAKYFFDTWNANKDAASLVAVVLRNQELWGTDLSVIDGFEQTVSKTLENMLTIGVAETIKGL
ncbi:MAG: altronate oxidoreductase, partial [Flavitalea sp.]